MDLIFKTKFGSELYGTNSPNSDTDYKGIYMATLGDIILRKDKHVIIENIKSTTSSRNSLGDVDVEIKELREFIKDALAGQTYALDMLFSTENLWINSSPIWEEIVLNRNKFLSKNVSPYLGYIRQQTAKYGLKGSRLAELQRVIGYYDQFNPKDKLQDHPFPQFSEYVKLYTTINERPHGEGAIPETYLEVLGKKFQVQTRVENLLRPLRQFNQEYGLRARKAAANEGVDWKAVSHAFRLAYQLIDLAETQAFHFPLKEAEKLKKIKNGQRPWLELQDELSGLTERAFEALDKSELPILPDKVFWEDFVLQKYLAKNK